MEGSNIQVNLNYLLVLNNKKLLSHDRANSLIAVFASAGRCFDKISFVAFDNQREIVRALKECKGNYSNSVIVCPKSMGNAVKEFVGRLYSEEFDCFGILSAEKANVFIIFSDEAGRLKDTDIIEFINKKSGQNFEKFFIKLVGAPSDEINSAIRQAKEVCKDFDFNITESFGECTIEAVYPSSAPKSQFDSVYRTLVTRLNSYVYALENITLAERLFQLLKLRRMKISTAESFTGGGISKKLVSVPGISEVFFEGLNTYSNESKVSRLGVSELTLKHNGAVSEQTAYQMAEGLINTGYCDIAVATTGIAGPKSDSSSKPVGLLYIAVGTRELISVYRYNLKGDRQTITETAINLALFHAYKTVK